MTVHSVTLDCKFRACPLDEQTPEANETESEPVVRVVPIENKKLPMPAGDNEPDPEIFRAKDLTEYLFGDTEGNLPTKLGVDETEEAYEDFAAMLNRAGDKLASKLVDMSQRILSQTDIKKLALTVSLCEMNLGI